MKSKSNQSSLPYFLLFLSNVASKLALCPLVMFLICVFTGNTLFDLIDLYYWFITPLQICFVTGLGSFAIAIATLILSSIYCKDFYCDQNEFDDIRTTIRMYSIRTIRRTILFLGTIFLILYLVNR